MLGYLLAALIGLSLGVLGGGGSILTVPIFAYVMHFEPKQAVAMSLPVVGAASLVGVLGHWREGNLDVRAALPFAVMAMIGAFGGARLASFVTGVAQLALLGIVMVAAAILMLRPPRLTAAAEASGVRGAPADAARRPRHLPTIALVGLAVGALTGLVGIGGGFLFVPALVLLAGLPMKMAVGTSLLVIAANALSATIGYLGQVDIPWRVVASFTVIAIAGILAGTRIVRYVPAAMLRRGFAYFLLVMAAFILYQNRVLLANPAGALRPSSAAPSR
ncbi:MAG TPA: sulfite exporter TauE/SafE family protein [Gemmatimonadaceae bacterium]|nr:sulfite exporter TauE/SafE family protein [Gemmatimonadaceae bacterium]